MVVKARCASGDTHEQNEGRDEFSSFYSLPREWCNSVGITESCIVQEQMYSYCVVSRDASQFVFRIRK